MSERSLLVINYFHQFSWLTKIARSEWISNRLNRYSAIDSLGTSTVVFDLRIKSSSMEQYFNWRIDIFVPFNKITLLQVTSKECGRKKRGEKEEKKRNLLQELSSFIDVTWVITQVSPLEIFSSNSLLLSLSLSVRDLSLGGGRMLVSRKVIKQLTWLFLQQ